MVTKNERLMEVYMIVLTGASGAGKSSVERYLCERYGLSRIISTTTRKPRIGEVDGVDYRYVSVEEFKLLDANGLLAEKVEYNGNFYGIQVKDCHLDAIAVVEPNGLQQLMAKPDIHVKAIFIDIPESVRYQRMIARGDSEENAKARIQNDATHFANVKNIDAIVYNYDLMASVEYIYSLIKAWRI